MVQSNGKSNKLDWFVTPPNYPQNKTNPPKNKPKTNQKQPKTTQNNPQKNKKKIFLLNFQIPKKIEIDKANRLIVGTMASNNIAAVINDKNLFNIILAYMLTNKLRVTTIAALTTQSYRRLLQRQRGFFNMIKIKWLCWKKGICLERILNHYKWRPEEHIDFWF